MSNYLAIATVTAALGQIVRRAARSAVSGATVFFGRPTAQPEGGSERRVHVYLYQVTPNAALANADLPTRRGDRRLMRRPQAAFDLHYLLSFFGDDQRLEPDRMLGAVTRALHAEPLLGAQDIQDAIDSHAELVGSNLAESLERVRFTQAQLSLDELSKLWSVMVQLPHALSIAYHGALVLIDADESAASALPVLERGEGDRGVSTQLGAFPRLRSLFFGSAAAAARHPRPPSLPCAELGTRIAVRGEQLNGEAAVLRFARADLPGLELGAALEPGELVVDLPDDAAAQDAWAAGVYTIRAVITRSGAERASDALPIALAPRITAVAPNPAPRDAGGDVELTLTTRPRVRVGQRAVLLLADREIEAQPLAAATDTLSFSVPAAPPVAGELVRLRVDGIESLPFRYDETARGFAFDDAQRVTIT